VPSSCLSTPVAPVSGGARRGRRLVLEASDGNRFAGFSAATDIADAPGAVVLPDVGGLHPFYEELALRFGDAGVHALALDYNGRTAGTGTRGDDFDHEPHFEQATDYGVGHDVTAATEHIRSPEGGGASSVFTVGFCFGGRVSFNQSASRQDQARRRRLLRQGGGRGARRSHRTRGASAQLPARCGCNHLLRPSSAIRHRGRLRRADPDWETLSRPTWLAERRRSPFVRSCRWRANTPTVEADVCSPRTSTGLRPSTAILSSMSSVRPCCLTL
jgi:Dienelactone hydrolase family